MAGFQFCEPNCPRRKPGCQDHCEYHAKRKQLYKELKAKTDAGKEAYHYTYETKAKNFDRRIKRGRTFQKSAWRRTHG